MFFEQSIPYFNIVCFRKWISQEVNAKLSLRWWSREAWLSREKKEEEAESLSLPKRTETTLNAAMFSRPRLFCPLCNLIMKPRIWSSKNEFPVLWFNWYRLRMYSLLNPKIRRWIFLARVLRTSSKNKESRTVVTKCCNNLMNWPRLFESRLALTQG